MESLNRLHQSDCEEINDMDTDKDDIVSMGKKKKKMLKKAPNAPKRFKSAYICFVMEKMDEVKATLPSDTKITDLMKHLANLWKDLPPNDKKRFEEMAEIDKNRYFSELSTYQGPLHIPKQKVKKALGAPKRAISAFLSFSQQMRPTIRNQHPDLKTTDLSRLLAEEWKAATEEQRRPHLEKEVKEREKYHIQMAQWRKSQSINTICTSPTKTMDYLRNSSSHGGNNDMWSRSYRADFRDEDQIEDIDYFHNLSSFVSSSFYNNSSNNVNTETNNKLPDNLNSSKFLSVAASYSDSQQQQTQIPSSSSTAYPEKPKEESHSIGGGVSEFFRSFVQDNDKKTDIINVNTDLKINNGSIVNERKESKPKIKKLKKGAQQQPISVDQTISKSKTSESLLYPNNKDLFNYSTISPLDIAFIGSKIKTAQFLSDVGVSKSNDNNNKRIIPNNNDVNSKIRSNGTDLHWLQQVRIAQHQLDEKKSIGFSNYSNYQKNLLMRSNNNINQVNEIKNQNLVAFELNNNKVTKQQQQQQQQRQSDFFFPEHVSVERQHQQQQQQQQQQNQNHQQHENIINPFIGKKQLLNVYNAPPLVVAQSVQAPNYTQSDFADFISNTFYNVRADDLDFYQNSYIEKLDEMNDDHFNESKQQLSNGQEFNLDNFDCNFEDNSSHYDSLAQIDSIINDDNKEIKSKNTMKSIINNTASYYNISEKYTKFEHEEVKS